MIKWVIHFIIIIKMIIINKITISFIGINRMKMDGYQILAYTTPMVEDTGKTII